MKSLLDGLTPCVLESARYQVELLLVVAQLHKGKPEPRTLSRNEVDALEPAERIRYELRTETVPTYVDAASPRAVVRFRHVIAWQVVDESFTVLEKDAQRDSMDVIRVIGKSRYLDYLVANHGWYDFMRQPAKLYEVVTLSEIIFVLSSEPPEVERLPS